MREVRLWGWLALPVFWFWVLLLRTPHAAAILGGEKAAFPPVTWEEIQAVKQQRGATTSFDHNHTNNNSSSSYTSHRQNVCDRYDRVRRGEVELRHSLAGLEIRPVIDALDGGAFFQYTNDQGIDSLDPGFLALLMDELARRAGFTWRTSFAVLTELPPKPANAPANESLTYTDLLQWSVEAYDLSVSWWDQTLERLELGIAFTKPWFDGSIIMVQKKADPEVDDDSIQIWNWLRPFDRGVWFMTISTILASGLAYQWLEYLSGHGHGRSFWQWLSDNVYLSAISFPQNYEFQPRSAGARLFGVSISLWALVMTATYTANLASLLVDHKASQIVVESISDAIALDLPICVYEDTGADDYIKTKYRQASRVPLASELETYAALEDGQCALTLAYYQNWLGFEGQREYNPYCQLEWVGRTIKTIPSGFATSADVGDKCSSLVATVLDIFMDELLTSGFLEDMWDQHYAKTQDIDCDAVNPLVLAESASKQQQKSSGRRMTMTEEPSPPFVAGVHHHRRHRQLKAGGRGGAAGSVASYGGGDTAVDLEASTMTLNQMAGTFILHWWVTALAIVIGYTSRWYKRRRRQRRSNFVARGKMDDTRANSSDEPEHAPGDHPHHDHRAAEDKHDLWVHHEELYATLRGTQEELQVTRIKLDEQRLENQRQLDATKQEMQEHMVATQRELQETRRAMKELLKLLHDQQPMPQEAIRFY